MAVLRFASDITDMVFGFDYFFNGFVTTLVLLRSFGFALFAITISFNFKEGDPPSKVLLTRNKDFQSFPSPERNHTFSKSSIIFKLFVFLLPSPSFTAVLCLLPFHNLFFPVS